MSTTEKETSVPSDPTVIKFKEGTLEHMLDRAYVGSTVNQGLYNQVVAYVDQHDIKDEETFNAHIDTATAAWMTARAVAKLPPNSTLRSVISKVRGALREEVSFFDTEGNMKGATELGRVVAANKEASLSDEEKVKIILKKLKPILTQNR